MLSYETHETTLHETHETALPRPLGALEKLFWFINQNRPTHFAIAAEVGGSTRVKQWQDALDRVCRQSALIWSRLVSTAQQAQEFFAQGFSSSVDADGRIPARVTAT